MADDESSVWVALRQVDYEKRLIEHTVLSIAIFATRFMPRAAGVGASHLEVKSMVLWSRPHQLIRKQKVTYPLLIFPQTGDLTLFLLSTMARKCWKLISTRPRTFACKGSILENT